jgi:RNA polymerase sigma-70 factor, ECF subfamily
VTADEREAIGRLRAGDVGGLEYFVHEYSVRAIQTAYLVTHDLQMAEDVAQDAFLKAYERIGQFDVSRPFGPWFLTSVLHASVKAAQKRRRHQSLADAERGKPGAEADWLRDGRPGPEELWEKAETAEELEAALAQLSPKHRAAVVARYFLGMSEAEAAAAMECPQGTIKWRLHAARERLRVLLAPLRAGA